MSDKCPVTDWARDYDILDPSYIRDPAPVWREMRKTCPIARTERHGGSWLPIGYDDIQALVKMVPELSSKQPSVIPLAKGKEGLPEAAALEAPPITSDPPDQIEFRRLILPFFHAREV